MAAERQRWRRRVHEHRGRAELGELHSGPGAGQPRPPGRRELHRPHGTLETLTSPVTGVTGDLFIGTPGADNFTGTAGEDHIFGRGGNDTLNGANGNDIIAGEAGNDTINGGNGDDTVQFTGTGDGFDAVTGAAGNDTIVPTTANTNVGLTSIATTEFISNNGFAGLHVVGSGNADTLNFTAVTLTGVVNIDGGGGNDTLTGSQNADVMLGGAGNDTLNGGNGNDTLIGNAGNDTLNGQGDNDIFQFAGTGNGFDAVTGAAGTDRVEATSNATDIGLSSIATVEQVSANAFSAVHVVGTANADTLNFSAVTFTGVIDIDGAAGADTLTGSALSDTIIGGAGNDNITPGTGNDRLRYAAGFGQDTVTGFDSNPTGGQDKLDIQALGITSATFNASVTITNVGWQHPGPDRREPHHAQRRGRGNRDRSGLRPGRRSAEPAVAQRFDQPHRGCPRGIQGDQPGTPPVGRIRQVGRSEGTLRLRTEGLQVPRSQDDRDGA